MKSYTTDIEITILGVTTTAEVEIAYEHHPNVPGASMLGEVISPDEMAECKIAIIRIKSNNKWIDASWLFEILDEAEDLPDVEEELLDICHGDES